MTDSLECAYTGEALRFLVNQVNPAIQVENYDADWYMRYNATEESLGAGQEVFLTFQTFAEISQPLLESSVTLADSGGSLIKLFEEFNECQELLLAHQLVAVRIVFSKLQRIPWNWQHGSFC
ncbi:hypothetical protein BMS3Bbin04_00590 [bacterium BMS3Bbin04]|nr:hypothetical protein BMS3Bbin04_00590 [bacterium BMS3Bbin04]